MKMPSKISLISIASLIISIKASKGRLKFINLVNSSLFSSNFPSMDFLSSRTSGSPF